MQTRRWRATVLGAFLLAGLSACAPGEPDSGGGPLSVRRLTGDQYRQAIADVFGPEITIPGRFEPEVRTEGLLAVGAATVTVTPAGFEQFDQMARGIAAQVLNEERRSRIVGCVPAAASQPDDACAASFLERVGRLLFRRPLIADELNAFVQVAGTAAHSRGDFYAGLEFGLAGLLVAPEFLFRTESTESDPATSGGRHLDSYSMASRLSFLLWNASPDDELIAAAERGELRTRKGLTRQVDRLMASPRLQSGVRAFFADFLGFEAFESLAKDPKIFPKYSIKVAADAREQTLLLLTDHLITRGEDYRDLFTTRRTFMTRALGIVHRVRVETRQGWEPYEFPDGDPRAGLTSQVGFVALHAHPGRSSATLRGKAVRELLLCQKVPMPPANVTFSLVQETDHAVLKTGRDRLLAHSTDPTCAGCHKVTDPIGLALENFDGLGAWRDRENGVAIDGSGELDGVRYENAAGLNRALRNHPAVPACLVDRLYRYAAGRSFSPSEAEWQTYLNEVFAADGYRLPALLRRIALSTAFYRVTAAPDAVASKEQ